MRAKVVLPRPKSATRMDSEARASILAMIFESAAAAESVRWSMRGSGLSWLNGSMDSPYSPRYRSTPSPPLNRSRYSIRLVVDGVGPSYPTATLGVLAQDVKQVVNLVQNGHRR